MRVNDSCTCFAGSHGNGDISYVWHQRHYPKKNMQRNRFHQLVFWRQWVFLGKLEDIHPNHRNNHFFHLQLWSFQRRAVCRYYNRNVYLTSSCICHNDWFRVICSFVFRPMTWSLQSAILLHFFPFGMLIRCFWPENILITLCSVTDYLNLFSPLSGSRMSIAT